MTNKIFFFDLDGTLRRTKSGATFINNPEDQEPIPNAEESVSYYASKDYLCLGITNQGGVAAGHKSLEDTIKEQQITLSLFPGLSSIFFCPNSGESCWQVSRKKDPVEFKAPEDKDGIQIFCRKPGYGMILVAAAVHNVPDSDLQYCWLSGDRPEDQECAAAAKINFMPADILVR